MASSADTKEKLGSKENPIMENEAPPTAAEKGDANKVVPAVESDPNASIAGAGIGGVVAMGSFQMQSLGKVRSSLVDVDRNIAIALKNCTPYNFQSTGIFYYSGTSDAVIPYSVQPNYVCLWGARKSAMIARGAIGTFSYFMPDVNKTLHVMYQVPFDYNCYDNWWNATVVDNYQSPNSDLHYNLYEGKGDMPYPNKAGSWASRTIQGFCLLGNMTTNAQATLELEIRKA